VLPQLIGAEGIRRNLSADFHQMQVHRLGVGAGRDHRGADRAIGADGTEQVGGLVAVVAHH
jgi:hypothetical protein